MATDDSQQKSDDFHSVQVELTDEHLEGLNHGSGVTFEFGDSDATLAVQIETKRDLDRDWLLDGSEEPDTDPVKRAQLSTTVGIGIAMAGMVWASTGGFGVSPLIIGGVVSLVGGMIAIDQIDAVSNGVNV
jgi:hypothetical protein